MDDQIYLVDVGARGGIDARWTPYLDKLHAVAFEPDPAECEALASRPWAYQVDFIATALGDRNNQSGTLFLTRHRGCSSTLRPNMDFCSKYEFGPNMEVVGEHPVTMQRMDSVLSVQPDVIKVDTQGTELYVLQGAGALLDRCLAIEAEVEFDYQYVDQPLFGEVDAFVRAKGFSLRGLKRSYWRVKGQHVSARGGKLIHGDALWIRDGIEMTDKGQVILAAYRQDDLLPLHGVVPVPPVPRWRTILGRLTTNKDMRRFVDSCRPSVATDWHDPDFY